MSLIVPRSSLRSLDRLVDELAQPLFGTTSTGQFAPAMDIVERDGEILLRLDVPGVKREDLNVEVHQGRLIVSGERRHEEAREGDRHWHFERTFGSFRRALTLPRGVTESDVHASYEEGVLEIAITLPKRPEPAKIEIG